MQTSRLGAISFYAIVAAIIFSGCSGFASNGGDQSAGLPVSNASSPARVVADGAPTKPVTLFAALSNSPGAVYAYASRRKKCDYVGDYKTVSVNDIATDSSGNLWVPSQAFGGVISTAFPISSYAPNCGKAGPVLEDTHGGPAGIAFDSKGNAYVLEADTVSNGNVGAVSVFLKGQTNSKKVLSKPIAGFAFAIGIDSQDNVYVSYLNAAKTGTVVEFPKGKSPGKTLKLKTTYFPGGTLIFDKQDNMLINENNVVGYMLKFAPPYNGKPTTFSLKGSSWQCALDQHEIAIACADGANNGVDIFAYPSFAYQHTVIQGLAANAGVIGVAFSKAAPN